MSERFTSADLLLRIIAKILDFIIIVAAMEMIPKAGFFAGLVYLLIGDGLFDGRSLGKKLIGLRVISVSTNKQCTFKESILRNSTFALGYILYKIPWFGWVFIVIVSALEFIILLGSRERMRLGDELAKTKVVTIVNTDTETVSRGT